MGAHREWVESLNRKTFESLLDVHGYDEIARRGLRIESHTNLLFSFEKVALRDTLAILWEPETRDRTARLDLRLGPRAWVVRTLDRAGGGAPSAPDPSADVADRDFEYRSTPQRETYSSLLDFARRIRGDQVDLGPHDMIDAQSFIWTQGSAEYV